MTASTSVGLGMMHNQCPSLIELCLGYITVNLRHVESFQGFPELIGEQIFNRWLASISNHSDNLNQIQKFCQAYGSSVLRCLSLKNCRYFIDTFTISLFGHFQFIEELDISYCKLGDDHEMLIYISQLTRLSRLSLKDNYISDAGIMKWTMSRRFYTEKFQNLICLDLSCNLRISDRSIRYLIALKSIQTLNVSNTSISPIGIKKLQDEVNFSLWKRSDSDDHDCDFDNFTNTSGWITDWIEGKKVSYGKKHEKVHEPKSIKSRLGDCILRKRERDENLGLGTNLVNNKLNDKCSERLSGKSNPKITEDIDDQLLQLYS